MTKPGERAEADVTVRKSGDQDVQVRVGGIRVKDEDGKTVRTIPPRRPRPGERFGNRGQTR